MTEQTVIVTESERTTLRESSKTKGRWRIQLIEADVQGSSGFYPAAVIERDVAKAFPAGTQVFLDHPTESEEWERPERSMRDLVGVLVSEAWYENGADGHGGFGDMQVFPQFKESVEAWAPHVGMSIRAMGLRDENGEVTQLIKGESVDIVTRAGAGGKLVAMTESARKGNEAKPYAELAEADRTAIRVMFDGMEKLTESVAGLTEKFTKLEEAAATKEAADVLSPGEVYAKLSGSGLPQVVTTRLANSYKKGVDLDARIAEEKAVIEEITAELKGTVETAAAEVEAEADAAGEGEKTEVGVQESAQPGRTQTLKESAKAVDADDYLNEIFGGL